MRRLAAILLLAAAITGNHGAAAQNTESDAAKPFDLTSYPAGVQTVLQAAGKTCKEAGGGGVKFAPDTVHAVNLTSGEHSDYIIDLRDAVCQDRENVFLRQRQLRDRHCRRASGGPHAHRVQSGRPATMRSCRGAVRAASVSRCMAPIAAKAIRPASRPIPSRYGHSQSKCRNDAAKPTAAALG